MTTGTSRADGRLWTARARADALEAQYRRRAEAGMLYGFLPFVT
ncbi:hypothetical protein ACFQ3C_18385 [Seohaeicola saemankumensis]|uniref:Uncharacterized protein n=1 Tax=Seohaeicola saemankumensis TaxID=481181 RepID=A0ABW3THH8_9RHOB